MANEKYQVPGTEIELYDYAKWARTTIADGRWLQRNTVMPIYENELILASAIVDYTSDQTALIARTSAILQSEIDFISTSAESLKQSIITASGSLQTQIDEHYSELITSSGTLQGEIDGFLDTVASTSSYLSSEISQVDYLSRQRDDAIETDMVSTSSTLHQEIQSVDESSRDRDDWLYEEIQRTSAMVEVSGGLYVDVEAGTKADGTISYSADLDRDKIFCIEPSGRHISIDEVPGQGVMIFSDPSKILYGSGMGPYTIEDLRMTPESGVGTKLYAIDSSAALGIVPSTPGGEYSAKVFASIKEDSEEVMRWIDTSAISTGGDGKTYTSPSGTIIVDNHQDTLEATNYAFGYRHEIVDVGAFVESQTVPWNATSTTQVSYYASYGKYIKCIAANTSDLSSEVYMDITFLDSNSQTIGNAAHFDYKDLLGSRYVLVPTGTARLLISPKTTQGYSYNSSYSIVGANDQDVYGMRKLAWKDDLDMASYVPERYSYWTLNDQRSTSTSVIQTIPLPTNTDGAYPKAVIGSAQVKTTDGIVSFIPTSADTGSSIVSIDYYQNENYTNLISGSFQLLDFRFEEEAGGDLRYISIKGISSTSYPIEVKNFKAMCWY